jgi:hypothetical protein
LVKYKNRFLISNNLEINKKGQAASTDALLFLAIVGIVFTLIIGYSMTYGLNIMNNAKKLYNNNFHYAALKTFMNASYGRDGEYLLTTNVSDSVATMIKEDYGANSLFKSKDSTFPDKNLISKETKLAMFGVLDEIFLPLPQRSYLLLITHTISNNSTIKVPLILLIKRFSDSESKYEYFACYPNDPKNIEEFLQLNPLDLEIVEGNFILYKNILSKETDTDKKITKEDGTIYLASWLSSGSELDFAEILNCEDNFTDFFVTN